MKELSIEEKAKAYDEAWHKAKRIINVCVDDNTECRSMITCIQQIFPELKESEDERIRKCIGDVVREHDWSHIFGVTKDDCLAWIEKQAEQKPNDRVEPKFHEGEWITNGDYTWKIVEVKPLDYILQSQDGNIVDDTISHVDGQFHSFTIEDAKDGDVLSYRDGQWIFIYKEKIYNNSFFYHALYSTIHQNLTINNSAFTLSNDAIVPATKEQRDLLFQKMHEAGWEFDFDKKVLKKIEQEPTDNDIKEALRTEYEKGRADAIAEMQKPAWSEEDEEMLKIVIKSCERCGNEYAYYWLKSLKDRVQPQPKQEWNEEDEEFLRRAINATKDAYPMTAKWLKSLKHQNRWKPSDEQIKALHDLNLTGNISYAGQGQVLIELYNNLKKLTE